MSPQAVEWMRKGVPAEVRNGLVASRRGRYLADRHKARVIRSRSRWLMITPGIAILLAFNVFPLIYGLWVSLRVDNLSQPNLAHFVGLANYRADLASPLFLSALGRTVEMTAGSVMLQFVVGFLIALVLSRRSRLGQRIFASLLILPLAISPLVNSILWNFMLNPEYGVITYLIRELGLGNVNPLGSPLGATLSVIVLFSWEWTPFVALFLYSAIIALDRDPFEAAAVDGASQRQIVLKIMLPALRNLAVILLILQLATAFQLFVEVDLLTNGGPGASTETLTYLVFQNGLNYFDMGTATSMAWIMVIIMSVLAVFFIRTFKFQVRQP